MGEFNSDDHHIYYCGQESLRRNETDSYSTKANEMQHLGAISKTTNHLCLFPGKPFSIIVIQVYAPISNAEETEVKQFYEDLQGLLELTPPKDVLFIIRDWNAKVGTQEIPGVIGKFGLGVWNEAGQRLTEFCHKNAQVIANTLF